MDPLAELLAHTSGQPRLRTRVRTPTGEVRLRDARPTDADDVHGLLLGVLGEGRGFVAVPDEVGPDPSPTRAALDAVQQGGGVGVVAERAGRVVGYAIARPSGPRRLRHDAHLELVLAPSLRGAGLGGQLLDALVERARLTPWLRRLSLSVFDDNTPAVRLYRSRGFVDEGVRRGAILEDDGSLRDDRLMVLWVGPGPST